MSVSSLLTGCYRKVPFKRKLPNGATGLWWATGQSLGDATGGWHLIDLRIDPPSSLNECLSVEGVSLHKLGGLVPVGMVAFFPALEYLESVPFALRFAATMIDTTIDGYRWVLPVDASVFKGFIAFPTNQAVAMSVSGGCSVNTNGQPLTLCAWGYTWAKSDLLQGTPGAIPPAEVAVITPAK